MGRKPSLKLAIPEKEWWGGLLMLNCQWCGKPLMIIREEFFLGIKDRTCDECREMHSRKEVKVA